MVVLVLVVVLVLHLMQVLVGGTGDTGDQQHHLPEADLGVLVDVQVLHDLLDGGLVLHVLPGRRGQSERLKIPPEWKKLSLGF